MKNFRQFLVQQHITPKWLIFLVDVLLCICSLLFAVLLLNTQYTLGSMQQLLYAMSLAAVSAVCCFALFETHDGIIRYSDSYEAIRCVMAVFSSFVFMLLINTIALLCNAGFVLPLAAFFIYFFIVSFLIVSYRLFVKKQYKAGTGKTGFMPVVMFGSADGSLLMQTVEKISNEKYKVVAFIEDDKAMAGKSIDGVKIYHWHDLQQIVHQMGIQTLFFSNREVDVKIKNRIADICLNMQVKLMNIPPVQSWVENNLNASQLQEVKIEELLGRSPIQLHNEKVNSLISNKVILITGAAGSIGSELSRQIAAMYPQGLIICDQSETGLYELEYELQQKYGLGSALQVYVGDVTDKPAMIQIFARWQPRIVFHAAAYKHVPMMEQNPCEAIRNNVYGTKVLADLSEVFDVEKFLLVSTDKAINPTNIMGASKRIAEMYCSSLQSPQMPAHLNNTLAYLPFHKKTNFIITRFGNVLGSNGSVIPRFRQQIMNGGPVTVTHPDVVRYFMTIPEACSLVLEAITMGEGGELFLFDMGEPVKILDVANKMIRLAGREPEKDIDITFTGLRAGEKLYEELLANEEEVLPTYHKKILIAKARDYTSTAINNDISLLLKLAHENLTDEVVQQIKHIVPEYQSSNTAYQQQADDVLTKTTVISL